MGWDRDTLHLAGVLGLVVSYEWHCMECGYIRRGVSDMNTPNILLILRFEIYILDTEREAS